MIILKNVNGTNSSVGIGLVAKLEEIGGTEWNGNSSGNSDGYGMKTYGIVALHVNAFIVLYPLMINDIGGFKH